MKTALSVSFVGPGKDLLVLHFLMSGTLGLILVVVCGVLVGEIRHRLRDLS